MASTTTANMSLVKPVASPAANAQPGPTWATDLNSSLDLVDAHDHSSGKGVTVKSAGISINASLEMNDQSLTKILSLDFKGTADSETSAKTQALFVSSDDNKVKYRNSAGVLKPWTDAFGDLDVSVSGGIGGNYGDGDEILKYSTANTLYELLSDDAPSNIWAGMSSGDVRIYEKAAVTKYVALKSPGSLANTYTLTMPAAIAAGVLTTDGAGQLAFETTIPDNLTLSGDNIYSGIHNVSGTYTAKVRHGEIVRSATLSEAAGTTPVSGGCGFTTTNPTGFDPVFFVDAPVGQRITSVIAHVAAESLVTDARLEFGYIVAGGYTEVAGATISTTGKVTVSAINHVIVVDRAYVILFDIPNTTGSLSVTFCSFTADKVA